MSAGKVVLIGVVGLGLALGVAAIANASSKKSSAGGVPPGWTPPAGAQVIKSSSSIVAKPLNIAVWPAAQGQPPGHYQMFWAPSDPQTFLVLFWPDGQTTPALMDVGTTPESITLQQGIPQLVASAQAQGNA